MDSNMIIIPTPKSLNDFSYLYSKFSIMAIELNFAKLKAHNKNNSLSNRTKNYISKLHTEHFLP
jgi:hypothetical protein